MNVNLNPVQMPCRGRKRFVSEGDGGLIKETSWYDSITCLKHFHSYQNFLSGDGRDEGEKMDFFIEKFISRAQPKLTSEELFAKVNSPQVLFSPNAHSAL